MSESNAQTSPGYFKLGLFVIIGALLMASGVLLLGGASIFERTIRAQTILTESVDGLDVGAAVKYRGLTMGKVTEIDIDGVKYGADADHGSAATGGGAIVVEMVLRSQHFPGKTNDQIESLLRAAAVNGLRARVTTAGFSDQAFVELNFLDPKAYPALQIGFKPSEIYIPSAPSEMTQGLEAVEHIAIDLQKANLPQVIAHYDRLAKSANAAIDDVNDLVKENRQALNTTIADLPGISRRMRSITDRTDALLNDPRLAKLIASLPTTAINANAAISDLRALVKDTEGVIVQDKDDLQGILADMRRAAADAADITDDARQNPARELFGQPPPHLKEGQ